MPEEINRIVVDHLATWCFAPTPAGVQNLSAEGIRSGVIETGDLMQDLAARIAIDVRRPGSLAEAREALTAAGAQNLPTTLNPGAFVFATIHRAENREPTALAVWPRILDDAARAGRPVILSLHPGTRAALERAGIELPAKVHVVEPLGYRTSLTLQLHAAAILTDSGGIQREAAWLGTPCLVLRTSTEWVEAVAASAGRMVVIGLDRARAAEALARLAPTGASAEITRARVDALDLQPTGAARRIVDALETTP